MNDLLQMLQRGVMGGVVFAAALAGFAIVFYLLYRLINVSKRLTRTDAEKQAEAQVMSHKFWPVSKRGRAAYLILCLEEALQFYKQDCGAWEWVLRELWAITTIPRHQEDDWISPVCDILPVTVLRHETLEELKAEKKAAIISLPYTHSSEQFLTLRTLYINAGHRMIVLNPLMEAIYDVIADEWGDNEAPHTPNALRFIDEAQQLLSDYRIPLPHNETVLRFIMSRTDAHIGEPFDGLRFSVVLTSQNTQ